MNNSKFLRVIYSLTVVFIVAILVSISDVPTKFFPRAQEAIRSALNIPTPTPTPPELTLTKSFFGPAENIVLSYEGLADQKVDISIKDNLGKTVSSQEYESVLRSPDNKFLDIFVSRKVKPGKYHLTVSYQGQSILDQDLFLRTVFENNKSLTFKTNTEFASEIVLFNNDGAELCNPDLNVQIFNTTTTEQDAYLAPVDDPCEQDKISINNLSARVINPGTYVINVSSDTNLPSETVSTIDVVDSPVFEVRRETQTLMSAETENAVKITVTATQDFEGTISDFVPSNFEITSGDFSSIIPDNVIKLRYPFFGDFATTLKFAENPNDPSILASYNQFGVKNHDGVDFALPIGTPVVAIDDGEITDKPEKGSDYGTTIVAKHAWGRSYYGHLSSIRAIKNQKIKKGEVIGSSGNSGLSTGPHLHFGIDPLNFDPLNGYLGKIDPLTYLSKANSFNTSLKKIEWKTSLKQGETKSFIYFIKIPELDYYFYLLGPIKIESNNNILFEENNLWKLIVTDALK